MSQSARQKRLATAGRTVNQDVLVRADPVARGEARQLRAVEAGSVAIVEIFKRRTLLKLCELLKTRHAAVFPVEAFAIEQQREPFLER
jgi:hypothetical protein